MSVDPKAFLQMSPDDAHDVEPIVVVAPDAHRHTLRTEQPERASNHANQHRSTSSRS